MYYMIDKTLVYLECKNTYRSGVCLSLQKETHDILKWSMGSAKA